MDCKYFVTDCDAHEPDCALYGAAKLCVDPEDLCVCCTEFIYLNNLDIVLLCDKNCHINMILI